MGVGFANLDSLKIGNSIKILLTESWEITCFKWAIFTINQRKEIKHWEIHLGEGERVNRCLSISSSLSVAHGEQKATSFPGSLFFLSLEWSKEGKKRDPGNEVEQKEQNMR